MTVMPAVSMRAVSFPQVQPVVRAPDRVEWMADEFRFGSLIDVRRRNDETSYRYQRGTVSTRYGRVEEVQFGRDPDAYMTGEVAMYALTQRVGRFMDVSGSSRDRQTFQFQDGEVRFSRGRFASMMLLENDGDWREVPAGVIRTAYEKDMGRFVRIQKLPFGKKGFVFQNGTVVDL